MAMMRTHVCPSRPALWISVISVIYRTGIAIHTATKKQKIQNMCYYEYDNKIINQKSSLENGEDIKFYLKKIIKRSKS